MMKNTSSYGMLPANAVNEETESLCINHFKLEFIGPDNLSFISKLHEKCREEGMLRRFKSPVTEQHR
jgi:hypothetical protein